MVTSRKIPVVLVGGNSNALAVARALSKEGIEVYAINHPSALVRHSRCVNYIELDYVKGYAETWREFLLGSSSKFLYGAVLLPMVDEAISMIADHYEALSKRYLMEQVDPALRLRLLDKLTTYDAAKEAGVATPWYVRTLEELESIPVKERYPMIIKPCLSHEFRKHFSGKYLKVNNESELISQYEKVKSRDLECVFMQFIDGPDDLLCSYYTVLDDEGNPLFDFTKRVIRRYPPNMGPGSYHITDWVPEAKELGVKFFQHVRLRGLGNVEFKLDKRDNTLKLIECNARFTEGTALAQYSGANMSLFMYDLIVGNPLPSLASYKSGVRLLDFQRDRWAYQALKNQGQITLFGWLKSIFYFQHFPYFSWHDPKPTLYSLLARFRR